MCVEHMRVCQGVAGICAEQRLLCPEAALLERSELMQLQSLEVQNCVTWAGPVPSAGAGGSLGGQALT